VTQSESKNQEISSYWQEIQLYVYATWVDCLEVLSPVGEESSWSSCDS